MVIGKLLKLKDKKLLNYQINALMIKIVEKIHIEFKYKNVNFQIINF